MSEYALAKSVERLADEREQIEAIVGSDLYYGELLPAYDLEDFEARGQFAARALASVRNSFPSLGVNEAGLWIPAMNSLQYYVSCAEEDPDNSFLRPGQIPIMRELADFLELDAFNRRGGFVVSPTSGGKTVMYTELVHATRLQTLIIVPTIELLFQTRREFERWANGRHLDIGFVFKNEKRAGRDVTITTYASALQNIKLPPEKRVIVPERYRLVIHDEGHELLGEQRRLIVRAFSHAEQIAFTATDEFSDKKKVADVLPIEISRMDIIDGQNKQLVAPHKTLIVQTPTDMRRVYVASTGEYAADVLYETINTDARNQVVIDTYTSLFKGKKAIAYCAGIVHAEHLAEMMRQQGIAARSINGQMSDDERAEIIEALKAGSARGGIDVVTNDRVLGAGFSEESLEVALMVAPTLSPLKLMQNAGRITRLWELLPSKIGYIVQFFDQNYAEPPVVFAEKKVSGYAQHGWLCFNFPEFDTSDFNIENVQLISDPDEISAIASMHSEQRKKQEIGEPYEGWRNLGEIAVDLGSTRAQVYSVFKRLEYEFFNEKMMRTRKGEDASDVFNVSANQGRFRRKETDSKILTYLSPALIEQIGARIEIFDIVPSPFWRTTDDVAVIYNRSKGWVSQTFLTKAAREQHDDLWGKYTPDGKLAARAYFSPEMISQRASELDINDYSMTPPLGWELEATVKEDFGDEAYEAATQRLRWRWHEGKIICFPDSEGNVQLWCPRTYRRELEDVMDPTNYFNRGRNLRPLSEWLKGLEKYGITLDDLEQEIIKVTEKEPALLQLSCGKYFNPQHQLEFYCDPKIAAHIREQATLKKLLEAQEPEIKQTLETIEAERSAISKTEIPDPGATEKADYPAEQEAAEPALNPKDTGIINGAAVSGLMDSPDTKRPTRTNDLERRTRQALLVANQLIKSVRPRLPSE